MSCPVCCPSNQADLRAWVVDPSVRQALNAAFGVPGEFKAARHQRARLRWVARGDSAQRRP
eukprot:7414317-Lingulodinium_polyedra.AAC.1